MSYTAQEVDQMSMDTIAGVLRHVARRTRHKAATGRYKSKPRTRDGDTELRELANMFAEQCERLALCADAVAELEAGQNG